MATVTIKNLDRLTKRLNNIADMDLKQRVNEATKIVHAQAKDLAPVNKRGGGGALAGSIHMESKKTKNGYEGRVYTNQEYSAYVEFGTGVKGNGTYPYEIEGVTLTYKDKGWAYKDPKTDEWVYTKGQEAQPYMYPSLHIHKKRISKILKDGVSDNLAKNCKGGQ